LAHCASRRVVASARSLTAPHWWRVSAAADPIASNCQNPAAGRLGQGGRSRVDEVAEQYGKLNGTIALDTRVRVDVLDSSVGASAQRLGLVVVDHGLPLTIINGKVAAETASHQIANFANADSTKLAGWRTPGRSVMTLRAWRVARCDSHPWSAAQFCQPSTPPPSLRRQSPGSLPGRADGAPTGIWGPANVDTEPWTRR
jgi:hypothetical protein